MQPHGTGRVRAIAAAVFLTVATGGIAAAQDIPLNYERLSSMEEPLATEIGDVTLTLTGLVDAPLTVEFEDDEAADSGLVGNFQTGALVQLRNRWRVSLSYFGHYASDEAFSSRPDRRYVDNVALSVGSAWGTVAGGNVSGVVREQTRRRRGAGNAALEFDDALGGLDEWGSGYTVRLGPWLVGAVVDDNADFQLGAAFRRPIDNTDYRFTLRGGRGVHVPPNSSIEFDSTTIAAVGEVIYGSTSFDAGLGYERLSSRGPDAVRRFVSTGVRGKTGMLGWSLEAHYGRIEDDAEVAVALGVQYDIARGLSANFGLNHARAKADAGTVRLVDIRDTTGILSLRYSL